MGKKSYEQFFIFADFWPFYAIFGHFWQIGVTLFAHGEMRADSCNSIQSYQAFRKWKNLRVCKVVGSRLK